MQFELKRLSPGAVQDALRHAREVRLQGQPALAESICLDILEVEPDNTEVLILLITSLADQILRHAFVVSDTKVGSVVERLPTEYLRLLYRGLVHERRGEAALQQRVPGYVAYDWFREAMRCYERAAEERPSGDDEALWRWNTVARIIQFNTSIRPSDEKDRADYWE